MPAFLDDGLVPPWAGGMLGGRYSASASFSLWRVRGFMPGLRLARAVQARDVTELLQRPVMAVELPVHG